MNKKDPSRLLDRIRRYIFNQDIELRERLLSVLLVSAVVATGASLIPMLMSHTPGLILNVVLLVISLSGEFILIRFKKMDLVSMIVVYSATLFLIPAMYFMQGGMHSAMPLWFILCSLIGFLMVPEKYKICTLILSILVYSGCLVTELVRPDLVNRLDSEAAVFSDILISYLATTLTLFVTLIVHVNTEKKQRIELERQQEQLRLTLKNDSLTGIPNRYSYAIAVADLESAPLPEDLIIVSADVNGLKGVNDTLGHSAGDELIIGAASAFSCAFSPYGGVYRTGGDEFIALLRTDKSVDELQSVFSEALAAWSGKLVDHACVSTGYAVQRDCHADRYSALLKLSDQNMYSCKAEFYSNCKHDRRRRSS